MVGRPATRTAERLPGLIAQSISSVCVQFVWIDCAPLTYLISHQRSGEAAMRKNISSRKKCVSLWSRTRRISRPPRPVSVQPHLNSTGHCRTLSYSPSTTSLASCPPASIISFLIRSSYPRRSLSARSHSSRPATAQVPLLTLFHPPHCVVFCVCLCLSSCVRAMNAIQHPALWWLLCLRWSVDPPLARQSGCQG